MNAIYIFIIGAALGTIITVSLTPVHPDDDCLSEVWLQSSYDEGFLDGSTQTAKHINKMTVEALFYNGSAETVDK